MSPQLDDLAARIDQLIELCGELTRENEALRRERAAWEEEKTKLVQRNDLAKERIEAMIDRLRSLEEGA